mmetsp:Transcript_22068/g.3665  ORF Transcript_22068/g.3665 Transcript_22068/m.3665 type:complete len:80 (-) Transcript_22068:37-276(-)
MILFASFIGGCGSTLILGALTGNKETLRDALLILESVGYFTAGICFLIAMKTYPSDLIKLEEFEGLALNRPSIQEISID